MKQPTLVCSLGTHTFLATNMGQTHLGDPLSTTALNGVIGKVVTIFHTKMQFYCIIRIQYRNRKICIEQLTRYS